MYLLMPLVLLRASCTAGCGLGPDPETLLDLGYRGAVPLA